MTRQQLQAEMDAAKIHQEAADRMAEARRKRNEELEKQRSRWTFGDGRKTVRRPAGGVS